MPKRIIIIDTDPGIEDALAILLALTFADFYQVTGKPANMKVALGVRAREFIELFQERIGGAYRYIR